jgi:hypothetical protein
MADYRQIATQAAQTYGIPVDTFLSLLGAESSWNPNALSPKGAIGIGQLMPATAKELGVDPYDPEQNIYGSAKYLAQQFKRFGDPALAVAAYNAGPSAVAKYGGVPPYEETQNYVARVMGTQMADQMTPQQMAPQQAAGYQPFSPENLSRSQRTMLGFAALRDAAAALRGNQTSFFSDAYSGLEQQHRYGQELAFRQAQEKRLIDENRQQRELTAMTEIRRLMAERQKALDYGYPTDAIDAQIAAYQSSLTAMGSAFGQPAQPAAVGVEPAAVGVEPAPQPLNVTTASEAVYNPNTSDADLDAAIQFLSRRAATDPNVQGVLKAAIDERNRRATAAETAGVTEERAAKFTEYGSQVADYLIQGYDQDGNPIFNPAVAGRGGRFISSWLQTPEYQGYVGALQNIKNNLTMDKLREAKAAGLTGSISNADLEAIARAASTLDVNDPIGTFNALLNLEREYGIDLGLGSRRTGGGGGMIGGLHFEEVSQ